MATASTPTTLIAIPRDFHSFAANVSPRGVDLEGRLDLSLDALIKERRKEHKLLKKQEVAKKQTLTSDKRKAPKQQKLQKQTSTLKNGQKAQRKALVDKNRGLPTLPAAMKNKKIQGKTKTSIAATTAKLRRQMHEDKAQHFSSRRLVVSPRAVKNNQTNGTQQMNKKKNAPQQTRKVTSPTRVVQPKNAKKLQALKQQPKTHAKTSVRQVMRSNNKKAKLSITITGQKGKKKTEKMQKTSNKVLLPGKLSQALAKKNSAAKKIVMRAKNRKASATKSTQVIRKVPGQWKKN